MVEFEWADAHRRRPSKSVELLNFGEELRVVALSNTWGKGESGLAMASWGSIRRMGGNWAEFPVLRFGHRGTSCTGSSA